MSDSGKKDGHGDKRLIRNSTAELFDVKVHTVNEHLKNIFEQGGSQP